MLLAASVVWDAPALKGARYGATQELWSGRLNQTLGGFDSSTFVGQAESGQGGNFYVTEFGVPAGADGAAAGAKALPLPLRITIRPGNPGVMMTQNYNPGTTSGGIDNDGVFWSARNNTNITGDASNHYSNDTFAFTKLTIGLAARVSSADGGRGPVVTSHDPRENGTHTVAMTLQPGRRYALTVWVACREWGSGDAAAEARQPEDGEQQRWQSHRQGGGGVVVGAALGNDACCEALFGRGGTVLLWHALYDGQLQARGHCWHRPSGDPGTTMARFIRWPAPSARALLASTVRVRL